MTPRYTAAELAAMPTLSIGQTDDLKFEDLSATPPVRVWLARTDVTDGEPYDNRVSIEHLIDGRWSVVHNYCGDLDVTDEDVARIENDRATLRKYGC